jgi:outer membrane protein
MIFRRFTLIALAASFMQASWAAPGLNEVYDLALQHDPDLAASEAARRAASEAVPQARAALLPQLSASAGLNRTHRELESTGAFTQNYTNRLGALSLSQVLYDRQAFLALDQADARVAQAELEFARAAQDLALRVIQAYTELLFAEDSLQLAEAKKTAIAAQREQAEQMHRGGVGTVTDIQEAQARFDLAVAEGLEAQNLLRVRRQALFKLTGLWLERVAPLSEDAPLSLPEPNDLDRWRDEARRYALEVRVAEKALEVARFDVERARSNHLPTLKLTGSSQWQSNTDLGYASDNLSSVGVQLAMPLLAGGRISSVTRETLARQDQAAELLRKAMADAELAAAESFHGVNDSVARVSALKQAVKSSEVALDAARIGLDVGYRTSVDVLNAQQQLFAARRDLLQQRYNYIQQRLKLKAAVGALSRTDLETVDQWLNK